MPLALGPGKLGNTIEDCGFGMHETFRSVVKGDTEKEFGSQQTKNTLFDAAEVTVSLRTGVGSRTISQAHLTRMRLWGRDRDTGRGA
jgi:hypothetical protein